MQKFLKQRGEDVYKVFKDVLNVKQGRTLSSDYRLVLQQIGLDFDISLIEDLKKQLIKEGITSQNGELGLAILLSLVALFSDHLLKQRFDKAKKRTTDNGTPFYYEVSYDEMFSRHNVGGYLLITPRQYKASVVYFYRNMGKNMLADPLLSMAEGVMHKSPSIKRSDIIRTLTSRREAVKQLTEGIRQSHSTRKISDQEQAFISIYNRTLTLVIALGEGDVSLNLGRVEGELQLK